MFSFKKTEKKIFFSFLYAVFYRKNLVIAGKRYFARLGEGGCSPTAPQLVRR